jgi:alpha-beta hydrolase superfamily lysophospholipase
MIDMVAMLSTMPPAPSPLPRRAALALAAALAGCAAPAGHPAGPPPPPPRQDGEFMMPDGARLPFRAWLPAGRPAFVMLALHGFNDSRDAWEVPAPTLTAAGIALYGPDQRGFGAAPGRGRWAGTDRMVADAAEMARLLARLHPDSPLVLLGESMGGAVLMCLATSGLAPPGARYVLAAPAVWGRATMNLFLRASLWTAATLLPDVTLTGSPIQVMATDNRDALIRLSRDPLTLRGTRIDTLRGLVDLEDAAYAAAPAFSTGALVLYGGRDELVPQDSTSAMWRRLPRGDARPAYYPGGYHLLLRDHGRAQPLDDVLAWMRDPAVPLPSGADRAATDWLAARA